MKQLQRVTGLGPLQSLIDEERVTEVMVNGPDRVYVEVAGTLYRTAVRFSSEAELRELIQHIVATVGRHIDEHSPLCDARLLDGSRVNATLPPISIDGPTLTIRKFARDRLRVDDLIRLGTGTVSMFGFLHGCVLARANVLISGGTGTGKTTLLNVLSGLPLKAVRQQIAAAIDIIVQVERLRDGSRKVVDVVELVGMEDETITLQDIFRFRALGNDEEGAIKGTIEPTGLRPRIIDRLFDMGLEMPQEIRDLFPDARDPALAW